MNSARGVPGSIGTNREGLSDADHFAKGNPSDKFGTALSL